ncbi:hypothetical protein jhhlp_007139 [Lomentospora prolificans]|uniref:DNA polymerase lambda n=1 Tax=Lomentospora prolificans TaxID=41688 RepID=A0A2N3N1U6_9PEZI|nr:hypothetical protein jhhlp_007139 [Lomentospora prolificans]
MSVGSQSLEEKHQYFQQLDTLLGKGAYDADVSSDEDALDQEEEAFRKKCRGFRNKVSVNIGTPPNTSQPSSQPQERQPQSSSQSSQRGSRPTPGILPERVVSAPLPTTIKATPASEHLRRRAPETIDLTTSFVEETPIPVPESVAPAAKICGLQRSETTPLPRKRAFPSLGQENSPSIPLEMKKRKRTDQIRLVPEAQRIFSGLKFFYIPDNDIAPVRRARIRKAREHGVSWTRDLREATHVVVDKHLKYSDIEVILKDGKACEDAIIVNDEFPLDCISFRHMLNPGQAKYQVTGDPARETGGKATIPGADSTPKKESLPLKPPPANAKRWDHLPNFGTPSQDSSTTPAEDPGSGAQLVPPEHIIISDDSQPILVPSSVETSMIMPQTKEVEKGSQPGRDMVGDELSGYINMMQEYRGLPLDDDHDDGDVQSLAGATAVSSESENEGDKGSGSEEESRRKTRSSKRAKKSLKFEERFACNQAGPKDKADTGPNARTIEILQQMCTYYSRMNDTWRTLSYRKAIRTLQRQEVKIRTAEEAMMLPNIGERLAQKIEEIVTTDRLQRLEYAQLEPLDGALQLFLNIYGVGLSQANRWIAKGYRTLDDLREKAKLSMNQRIGVDHYDDLNTRIPRREVEALGDFIKKAANRIDPGVELIVGGSYRRGADSSGDIDLIVTKAGTKSTADLAPFLARLVAKLEEENCLVATLAASHSRTDPSKWHGCCVLPPTPSINVDPVTKAYRGIWRRIDFLLVPESEIGAALIYFTGNDIFNRSMRLLASKKGMRLNQRGLFDGALRGPSRQKITEGKLVEGRNEKRIFEILGVKWREPHERWC